MNQQFIQKCPFYNENKQNIEIIKTKEIRSVQKSNQQSSFAQYVTQLHSSKQLQNSKHQTDILRRHQWLPRIEPIVPELINMPQHFVLSLNKAASQGCISGTQSPNSGSTMTTPRGKVQMSSFSQKKTMKIKKNNNFNPLTSRSTGHIKTIVQVENEDGIFLTKIGGEEVIEKIAHLFHQQTQYHPLIQKIDDPKMYEDKFSTFLQYIMGKSVFFNIEALKQKHIPLKISHDQYNQFKSYLLSSFINSNRGPPELIFEFSSLIEQYKYCIITTEQTFASIFNHKTENNTDILPKSMVNLAQSTYKKIYEDQTLCEYFIGIELDEQAKKLGRIVHQMMGWNCSVDYMLQFLRNSHKQMQLTNVHFTLFKQYMIESMKEIGLKLEQIELITQRMDGYRSCIINQDCLLDFYFQSSSLFKVQVKKYELLLQRDSRLVNFPDSDALIRHAHFLLKYITHQHQPLLTKIDLRTLHKHCRVKLEWIDAFRDNFFFLIKNINLDKLILQDYNDIWFGLSSTITNQQNIENSINYQIYDSVQFKVQINLQDNELYNDHFSEFPIKSHIHKIVGFIFRNSSLYKSNDLKVIHSQMKISDTTFSLFVQLLKDVMKEEKFPKSLIDQADQICSYYKNSICTL